MSKKNAIHSMSFLLCVAVVIQFSLVSCTVKAESVLVPKETPQSLTIEGSDCNIILGISNTKDFDYKYNKALFNVSQNKNNGIYITVSKKENAKTSLQDQVEINLPSDLNFSNLKIISKNAGVSICKINKPIDIVNTNGAISINVPADISNNINLTSIEGSATIIIDTVKENETALDIDKVKACAQMGYTFTLKQCTSSVTLPSEFTNYHVDDTSYKFISGNGLAKISADLTSSSLTVKLNEISNQLIIKQNENSK